MGWHKIVNKSFVHQKLCLPISWVLNLKPVFPFPRQLFPFPRQLFWREDLVSLHSRMWKTDKGRKWRLTFFLLWREWRIYCFLCGLRSHSASLVAAVRMSHHSWIQSLMMEARSHPFDHGYFPIRVGVLFPPPRMS